MADPRLQIDETGEGTPVVLLHGLTATSHYVVMGSRRLERSGHRVVAYDARGHGGSEPAPSPDAYGYPDLLADLVRVLDDRDLGAAVLVGASMGAHTAIRAALEHPDRVAGLVLVTPAHLPGQEEDEERLAAWDRRATGLERGGVDGFLDASDLSAMPEAWRSTVERVMRQRLERHRHPRAVADALRAVPRSAPFDDLDALRRIDAPTVVVGDRDAADPDHPLAVAQRYADLVPGAELVVEDDGESPLAWQGSRLSAVVADLAARTSVAG